MRRHGTSCCATKSDAISMDFDGQAAGGEMVTSNDRQKEKKLKGGKSDPKSGGRSGGPEMIRSFGC